jgi:hypothetical protein
VPLLAVESAGWRWVPSEHLVRRHSSVPAKLVNFPRRGEYTELVFAREIFTDSFLRASFLPLVNVQLMRAGQNRGEEWKRKCNDVAVPTFWKFFGRFLLENLISCGSVPKNRVVEVDALRRGLLGEGRFERISAALDIDPDHVDGLQQAVRNQLLRLFQLGNEATCDESLLAYHGQDMRDLNIDMCYPAKPHDYGLVNYLLISKVKHSDRCIVVEVQSRLPAAKTAPQATMLQMARRLLDRGVEHLHVTADSGFRPQDTPHQLCGERLSCTIAFKETTSADLAALHSVGTEGLLSGHGRTYTRDMLGTTLVTSFRRNIEHYSSVISSAYTIAEHAAPRPSRVGSYEFAQDMFNKLSAAEICALFNVDGRAHLGDVPALIKSVTGWDVLLPPVTTPNQRQEDVPITKESLSSMQKPALQLMANQIKATRAGATNSKDKIIESILKHHADAQLARPPPAAAARDTRNLLALQSAVRGPTTDDLPVCTLFSERYGFVDQFDRQLYAIYHLASMRTWVKVFVGSYLYMMLFNAWAAHDEQVAQRHHDAQRGRLSAGIDAPKLSMVEFILNLAHQIRAEFCTE